MAWTAPRTWVVGELVTAALFNTHLRDNVTFLGAARIATVQAAQTTTSTSYTDLTTSGPAVSPPITGTSGIVFLSAQILNTGGFSWMGFAISGTTTQAAQDSLAIEHGGGASAQNDTKNGMFLVTLTAGTANVFTAKYRVSAGTGQFGVRHIAFVPLTA